MTPETTYVHAATLETDSYLRIAATGGTVSVSTESEQSAGQGYPPTWQVRRYDIPVSLSMDTSVWWSGTSSPRCGRRSARTGPASTSRPTSRATPSPRRTCEPSTSSTGRPAAAPAASAATTSAGSPRRQGRRRPAQERHSPVSFPLLNPYGHVAFQAQRGDVHTVLVDGVVVKRDNRLVGADLAAARTAIESDRRLPARRHGRGDLAEGDEPRPARRTPGCSTTRTPTPSTSRRRRARHASRCSGTLRPADDTGTHGRTREADRTSSRRSPAASTSCRASTRAGRR